MKKTLYSALLATAMIPFAAGAQTTTPETTPPPADGATTDPADGATVPDATTPDTTEPDATTPGTDAPVGGADTDTPDTDAPDTGLDAPDTGMDTDTPDTDAPDTDLDATDDTTAAPGDVTTDTAGAASDIETPFVTVPPTGAWRTSDLEGKSVEDANGENIGSISDTLINEEGQVIAVLVGVGGFLGIGQKDVAVNIDALEFGPIGASSLPSAPPADAAPAPAADGMAGDAAPAAPATPTLGEDNLPDRIVLNVTREELEAAPAYGEPEEADAGADTGMMGDEPAPAGGMAPAQ